jgi:hypothetical protein
VILELRDYKYYDTWDIGRQETVIKNIDNL